MEHKNELWEIVKKSARFNFIENYPELYAEAKKEAGLLTVTGKDKYILHLLRHNIKVTNTPNSLVAYILGLTDEQPRMPVKYKGGTAPDCVEWGK